MKFTIQEEELTRAHLSPSWVLSHYPLGMPTLCFFLGNIFFFLGNCQRFVYQFIWNFVDFGSSWSVGTKVL